MTSSGSDMAQVTTRPVELVADRLYRLGAMMPLDGRISWVPSEVRGYQPANCYLILEGKNATLIDTGPALYEREIVEQLKSVLPTGAHLTVFVTRLEPEGLGNIGPIQAGIGIDRIITGGIPNMFDSWNEIPGFVEMWNNRRDWLGDRTFMDRVATGASIPMGGSDRLLVLPAPLRILATFWVYDRETRTLFTTDVFGHTTVKSPSESPVRSSPAEDDTTYEAARAQILAKFPWVAYANNEPIDEKLTQLFADRQVDMIAPMHGVVLRGKALVDKHLEILHRVLRESKPEDPEQDKEPNH
jgi:flavorubredoxin